MHISTYDHKLSQKSLWLSIFSQKATDYRHVKPRKVFNKLNFQSKGYRLLTF